jgi:hypothetical protein
MAMSIFYILLSRLYILFIKMATEMFLFAFSSILIAIFLPFRQADLTASALLQGIRGEGPQLHTLRLASAATSTCE